MSTQNVNVARFARNVEWDFFCDFQTLCEGLDSAIGELKNLVMSAIDGQKTSRGNHKRNFSFANSVKDDEFESTLEAWQHSRQSFQCCR